VRSNVPRALACPPVRRVRNELHSNRSTRFLNAHPIGISKGKFTTNTHTHTHTHTHTRRRGNERTGEAFSNQTREHKSFGRFGRNPGTKNRRVCTTARVCTPRRTHTHPHDVTTRGQKLLFHAKTSLKATDQRGLSRRIRCTKSTHTHTRRGGTRSAPVRRSNQTREHKSFGRFGIISFRRKKNRRLRTNHEVRRTTPTQTAIYGYSSDQILTALVGTAKKRRIEWTY
jgi:hypothetical protein